MPRNAPVPGSNVPENGPNNKPLTIGNFIRGKVAIGRRLVSAVADLLRDGNTDIETRDGTVQDINLHTRSSAYPSNMTNKACDDEDCDNPDEEKKDTFPPAKPEKPKPNAYLNVKTHHPDTAKGVKESFDSLKKVDKNLEDLLTKFPIPDWFKPIRSAYIDPGTRVADLTDELYSQYKIKGQQNMQGSNYAPQIKQQKVMDEYLKDDREIKKYLQKSEEEIEEADTKGMVDNLHKKHIALKAQMEKHLAKNVLTQLREQQDLLLKDFAKYYEDHYRALRYLDLRDTFDQDKKKTLDSIEAYIKSMMEKDLTSLSRSIIRETRIAQLKDAEEQLLKTIAAKQKTLSSTPTNTPPGSTPPAGGSTPPSPGATPPNTSTNPPQTPPPGTNNTPGSTTSNNTNNLNNPSSTPSASTVSTGAYGGELPKKPSGLDKSEKDKRNTMLQHVGNDKLLIQELGKMGYYLQYSLVGTPPNTDLSFITISDILYPERTLSYNAEQINVDLNTGAVTLADSTPLIRRGVGLSGYELEETFHDFLDLHSKTTIEKVKKSLDTATKTLNQDQKTNIEIALEEDNNGTIFFKVFDTSTQKKAYLENTLLNSEEDSTFRMTKDGLLEIRESSSNTWNLFIELKKGQPVLTTEGKAYLQKIDQNITP